MPVEGVLNPINSMQSEPGWPRIILCVYPRPPGEEGAADRDSSLPPYPVYFMATAMMTLPYWGDISRPHQGPVT